jgi:class 3 adenylate cyclase
MSSLPGGTVTFLFTDIEGSTRLLQELGDRYGDVVSDHRRLMRERMEAHGGNEIDTQGDAFFFSFPRAKDAAEAAVAAQRALAEHEWPEGREVKVRMGLHTGEPQVGEHGYLGIDVVRAARICSAGHGGQILASETTRALLGNSLPAGVSVLDLGRQNLKDIQHERIFQLALDDQPAESRPLKTESGGGTDSRADEIARSFEQRINTFVERQLEEAFAGSEPKVPTRLAVGGLALGLGALFAVLIVAIVIALIVKFVFF